MDIRTPDNRTFSLFQGVDLAVNCTFILCSHVSLRIVVYQVVINYWNEVVCYATLFLTWYDPRKRDVTTLIRSGQIHGEYFAWTPQSGQSHGEYV